MLFIKYLIKIGLDELLVIGKKTGNTKILDSILGMVSNYAKNTPNPEDLSPEFLSSTLDIRYNKCINFEDRNVPLMCKKI